jgi:TusA-related sulfurtransferase
MADGRYTPPLPHADIVVDAVGLVCPGPIVLLAKAVKDAQLGQVIEVVATDAGILADAPAWANRTGHIIIGAYSDDGRHRFWFRKAHD